MWLKRYYAATLSLVEYQTELQFSNIILKVWCPAAAAVFNRPCVAMACLGDPVHHHPPQAHLGPAADCRVCKGTISLV